MNEYYKTIASEEMSDFEEYYREIANWLPDNCRVAEVGIADGRSMILLASLLEDIGKSYTFYAIDSMDYGGDNQLMTLVNNIVKSGVKSIELTKLSSLDASCKFNDNFFDFVFIDASHLYEPTKADIRLWIYKVKDDGKLAGHDYLTCPGVNSAVNEVLNPKKVRTIRTTQGYGIWEVIKEPVIFQNLLMDEVLTRREGIERGSNWQNEILAEYINLDSRPDRNSHMVSELQRVGIRAGRRSGVLPQDTRLSNDKIAMMMQRTPGAIGCWRSQIDIMKAALYEGKNAFVMEDDLIFCDDIKERLDYIFKYLGGKNWDIVWLGGTYHTEPTWHKSENGVHTHPDMQFCHCNLNRDCENTDDSHIVRTYGAFSTHAYIVNKKSIIHILDELDQNMYRCYGIDHCMIFLQPNLLTYAFNPGCIKQMDNQSNIGPGITYFSSFQSLGAHWFSQRAL